LERRKESYATLEATFAQKKTIIGHTFEAHNHAFVGLGVIDVPNLMYLIHLRVILKFH
jgi:hypothetical protein